MIKKKFKRENAVFHKKDFLRHDLSCYDYIFYHPDAKSIKLDSKLRSELKGKLFVYGDHYHPEGLVHKRTFFANSTPVTLYVNKE